MNLPIKMHAVVFLLLATFVTSLAAQPPETRRRRGRPVPSEAEPTPITLTTRDGVKLRAIYLESKKEKSAIPVMIIHEWGGQASPYLDLAKAMQKSGYAVLILEYRGHGASRTYPDRFGKPKAFDTQRMGRRDIEAIIASDLESAKGFLKEQNDEGKLNLNSLVLVGIDEGAIFAAQWAQRDWAFPSVGRKKQGQDVKGTVYVSPKRTFKGVAMDKAIRDPALLSLPTLLIVGERSDEARDAKQMAKQIEVAKKRFSRGQPIDLKQLMLPTSLSGQALVNKADVGAAILKFIEAEVASQDGNEWIERD